MKKYLKFKEKDNQIKLCKTTFLKKKERKEINSSLKKVYLSLEYFPHFFTVMKAKKKSVKVQFVSVDLVHSKIESIKRINDVIVGKGKNKPRALLNGENVFKLGDIHIGDREEENISKSIRLLKNRNREPHSFETEITLGYSHLEDSVSYLSERGHGHIIPGDLFALPGRGKTVMRAIADRDKKMASCTLNGPKYFLLDFKGERESINLNFFDDFREREYRNVIDGEVTIDKVNDLKKRRAEIIQNKFNNNRHPGFRKGIK